MYHVYEGFGVAVDMITDGSSFPSGRKCVTNAAIGYGVAGNTVIAASEVSLEIVGLWNSI